MTGEERRKAPITVLAVAAALLIGAASGALLGPIFNLAWFGRPAVLPHVTSSPEPDSSSSARAGGPGDAQGPAASDGVGTPQAPVERRDPIAGIDEAVSATVYVSSGGRHGIGFALRDSGDIVTNEHVIAGSKSAVVSYVDGSERRMRLLGSDPVTDIALLDGVEVVPGISLADSVPAPGDEVRLIAARSPFERSVISGMVAALHRSAVASGRYYDDLMLLDSRVTSGMSGGPVVDSSGQVIGMVTLVSESTDDVRGGFALPSVRVSSVVSALADGRTPVHPFIGIQCVDRPGDEAGVVVTAVTQGAPAAKSGIRPGDIVLEVTGEKPRDVSSFLAMIAASRPGDTLALTTSRKGVRSTVKVPVVDERSVRASGGG